jgi:hypothetical protein
MHLNLASRMRKDRDTAETVVIEVELDWCSRMDDCLGLAWWAVHLAYSSRMERTTIV